MKKPLIKIIAGLYRGRTVPFDNSKFGDADITPQKVKGAVFSSIGEDLSGKSFLDLYGGSGQMGFEAMSRGAGPVVINEADKKRSMFIGAFAASLDHRGKVSVLNKSDITVLEELHRAGQCFDYIFLDPPYVKSGKGGSRYRELLDRVYNYTLLRSGGIIIVQHFHENSLEQEVSGFFLFKSRKYGTTSVTMYGHTRAE